MLYRDNRYTTHTHSDYNTITLSEFYLCESEFRGGGSKGYMRGILLTACFIGLYYIGSTFSNILCFY